ncbi:MAG: Gfo/Idh/MocA family oxidoreductase [Verrucomicrobiota bacterium]
MTKKKSTYGFGIVGCGMISAFHAKAIQAMRGAKLECVFSRNKKRAQALADEYGATPYTEYNAFLAHPGLDIVTICTPSGAHLEPAVAAAKAKKHVICEKPLEVTLERIDAMIAACRKNKVILSGIFPRRFNPATIALKKAVDTGRFGKLTLADAQIKWFRDQAYYDSGAWRGTWKLDGGGAIMNQSIHTIDLLIHVAGDVKSVCAFADRVAHKRIEVEDIAVAILKFKNGAVGTIQGATTCYHPDGNPAEVQLCGTEGTVFMEDDKFREWEFAKKSPTDKKIHTAMMTTSKGPAAGAADPSAIAFEWHQRNFEDTLKAIKAGKKPSVDGKEGRRAIEVILALYQSALAGGKRVDLPLKRTPRRKSFR